MSGLEVEAVEEVKPMFTNIKTVKIEKIDNHPNSDRLHLVTVNTGSGLKQLSAEPKILQKVKLFHTQALVLRFWTEKQAKCLHLHRLLFAG